MTTGLVCENSREFSLFSTFSGQEFHAKKRVERICDPLMITALWLLSQTLPTPCSHAIQADRQQNRMRGWMKSLSIEKLGSDQASRRGGRSPDDRLRSSLSRTSAGGTISGYQWRPSGWPTQLYRQKRSTADASPAWSPGGLSGSPINRTTTATSSGTSRS